MSHGSPGNPSPTRPNPDDFNAHSFHLVVTGERRPVSYDVLHGAIAQLVERFHGMEEVKGSIPFSSTKSPRSQAWGSSSSSATHLKAEGPYGGLTDRPMDSRGRWGSVRDWDRPAARCERSTGGDRGSPGRDVCVGDRGSGASLSAVTSRDPGSSNAGSMRPRSASEVRSDAARRMVIGDERTTWLMVEHRSGQKTPSSPGT